MDWIEKANLKRSDIQIKVLTKLERDTPSTDSKHDTFTRCCFNADIKTTLRQHPVFAGHQWSLFTVDFNDVFISLHKTSRRQ